ncbi:MAG: porin [Muribaculaceae bacterium]|nr:porin [Muribaculaceae bacterium]
MTRTTRFLLTLAAGSAAIGAAAAPPHHHEPTHSAELKESAHKAFTENAPDGYKDAVPHFAVFGKKDQFYLGIGGQLKVTLGEDWGAPLDNPNEFITSDISEAAPGNRNKFLISAMQSMIYLNFVGLPNTENQIGAFLGMNFLNDYVPVLQYAYLKWRGLKAGYDYTTFSDNGAVPPTIDYEGPNASTAFPTPMISYTYSFGKQKAWSATLGLELPQYSITPDKFTSSISQGVPDIPIALKYSWNKQQDWIRASAVVRNLIYRNDIIEKNVDIVGWGIEISGTSEIAPGLRGFWQGVYGHGIDSYIQDLNGLNMDLTPCGSLIPLKASKAWGAFGGLQYDFTDDVYSSISYSHVRNYAKPWASGLSETEWGGQYRYAQYAVANVFWNVNTILTTGLEYIYGRRVNNDGTQAHTNRMQAMVQLTF